MMAGGHRGDRSVLVLIAVALVAVLGGCSARDRATQHRLRETSVLRVGMDASFPPFEAVSENGSLVGFDVDLAREVSRRLGLEPQFVANLPYDGLYDALTAQRVDVVFSALAINPARTADFAYSVPYFDAGEVLVLRNDAHGIQSIADLDGQRLAVVLGSHGDLQARQWSRRLADLVVSHHQTPAAALDAVAAGAADAALVDHVSALQGVGMGSSLTVLAEPVVSAPYAAAVLRESRSLLRGINDALVAIEEDGTMDRLVAKWILPN
ncbi:MAG: ABC transporter substrate-binding protein [Anaerolineae bacterium]|jgi:polar amino acid transport system substrate-binding protein